MSLLDTMFDVGHSNCTRSIAIFLALSAQKKLPSGQSLRVRLTLLSRSVTLFGSFPFLLFLSLGLPALFLLPSAMFFPVCPIALSPLPCYP